MNTPVTPPPPSSSGAPTPKPNLDSAATPPTATVEIAPPPLAFGAPAEGRLVEGVVTARIATDQFALETNSGAITIRSATSFRIGAPLALQIISNDAAILAAILRRHSDDINVPATPLGDQRAMLGQDLNGPRSDRSQTRNRNT